MDELTEIFRYIPNADAQAFVDELRAQRNSN